MTLFVSDQFKIIFDPDGTFFLPETSFRKKKVNHNINN